MPRETQTLFALGVGSSAGMATGGSIQKEIQTSQKQADIDRIMAVLEENQIALLKIGQGEEISQREYDKLKEEIESLEMKLEIDQCAIDGYQNDIGNDWSTATKMVVVVGGTSIALSKLMQMTAAETVSISETLGKFNKGGSETARESAKGLIGKEFEKYLNNMLGGEGSRQIGGRDFDGVKGNRWWEAKSGGYWKLLENDPKKLLKFKSDMGDRLNIAKQNGATYELFSNTPIPQAIKDWLLKKGISFTEILD